MTYYTPPELREEMKRFDIVLSNPPFRADHPTGSGKTASFLLPLLHQLPWHSVAPAEVAAPLALIVVLRLVFATLFVQPIRNGLMGELQIVDGVAPVPGARGTISLLSQRTSSPPGSARRPLGSVTANIFRPAAA